MTVAGTLIRLKAGEALAPVLEGVLGSAPMLSVEEVQSVLQFLDSANASVRFAAMGILTPNNLEDNFFVASGDTGMLLTKGQGKRYFKCSLDGTAVRMVTDTSALGELRESLDRYREEGYEFQKKYAEIVNIDPSSASLMLLASCRRTLASTAPGMAGTALQNLVPKCFRNRARPSASSRGTSQRSSGP